MQEDNETQTKPKNQQQQQEYNQANLQKLLNQIGTFEELKKQYDFKNKEFLIQIQNSGTKIYKIRNFQDPSKTYALKLTNFTLYSDTDAGECKTAMSEIQNILQFGGIQRSITKYYGFYKELEDENQYMKVYKFYIIMDYHKESLQQLIEYNKKNNIIVNFFTFRQNIKLLVEGYIFMMNNNLYHRDVKPDNFLVKQEDKGNYTLVWMDFDVSKITFNKEQNINQLTFTGTQSYLCPEMTYQEEIYENQNKKRSLEKTDVFSFGLSMLQYKLNKPNYNFIKNFNQEQGPTLIKQLLNNCLEQNEINEWEYQFFQKCLDHQQDQRISFSQIYYMCTKDVKCFQCKQNVLCVNFDPYKKYHSKWFCDYCNKKFDKSKNPDYLPNHCKNCQFDLCESCFTYFNDNQQEYQNVINSKQLQNKQYNQQNQQQQKQKQISLNKCEKCKNQLYYKDNPRPEFNFKWFCNKCSKVFKYGFSYQCQNIQCDYDICSQCYKVDLQCINCKKQFQYNSNPYQDTKFKGRWFCDFCKIPYRNVPNYGCKDCEIDICFECISL